LTTTDYQAALSKHVAGGYRLAGVSAYGANGTPRFAAIFAHSQGPAWSARHGMTSADYERELADRVANGYRLVDVSGYSVGGQARFAAIFDKRAGPPWFARHGMSSARYAAELHAAEIRGYRLRSVSAYADAGRLRFAAIFEQRPGAAWAARHDMTAGDYQRELHSRVKDGWRLRRLSGYGVGGRPRYAALFEEAAGPSWVSYHAIAAADYDARFAKLAAAGYRLETVGGYVVAGETLYATIWVRDPAAA
jgi:hypothetical protein